jgi:polyvinyl alcohol dehydrogenase (cytochrome)
MWLGGGDSAMYSLNADTGKILWRTQLSTQQGAFIWSSPTLYHGSIYVGLSSVSDCPLVRGGLYQLDALTGNIQNTFYTVPAGCDGGGIWGSPTIDYVTGYVYVATGNSGSCVKGVTPSPYNPAILRLRASDLSLVDFWAVPPSQQVEDPDFGSTPTLFSATVNGSKRYLVGIANKNGVYYAFDRYSLSASPFWSARLAAPGQPDVGLGSISPSAWDGKVPYAAGGMTTIQGASCIGSVRALDPATGHFLWENCIQTGQRFGAVLGAVMAVPGVVIVAAGVQLRVVDAVTGKTLYSYNDTKAIFYGAASVSNGALYAADTGGNLFAFSPPASKSMVSGFRENIGVHATTFRWTVAEAVGIKGFSIYAGKHLLNRSLIKPSESLHGVYKNPWRKRLQFKIQVVMMDGSMAAVVAKRYVIVKSCTF